MSAFPLDQAAMEQPVRVRSIDGGHQMRCTLNNRGIHVGDCLTVIRAGILQGPIVVRVHGMDVAVGRHMAHRITVEAVV